MSHYHAKFGYELSKSVGNITNNTTTKMAHLMPILNLEKYGMEYFISFAYRFSCISLGRIGKMHAQHNSNKKEATTFEQSMV